MRSQGCAIMLILTLFPVAAPVQEAPMSTLPGTQLLTFEGDLAAHMVAGIKEFLLRETAESARRRADYWHQDFSSLDAYLESVAPNRDRLRAIVGAVDPRPSPITMELVASTDVPAVVGRSSNYAVYAVRWESLTGVYGEGLLVRSEGPPRARVIALPDCDWTPEMLVGLTPGVPSESQFARRLAESGCEVVVPVLLDRCDTFSGHPAVRYTNQPHREFVYRMAFEMGRHIIGYEVQKVLAAVDWCAQQAHKVPIGVMGYGEGGLVAFYSGALDQRIHAVCVSGYFAPRNELYQEPIYRNLFGLLREFSDAEIASLIAPRPLVIEACRAPEVDGPPAVREGRIGGAAPGVLTTPTVQEVRNEYARARPTYEKLGAADALTLVVSGDGHGPCGSAEALGAFLQRLTGETLAPSGGPPAPTTPLPDADQRMKRQVEQLCEFTQALLRRSEQVRAGLWADADKSSPEAWEQSTRRMREFFWDDVIGRFPPPNVSANPRTRLAYDEPTWRGYEVVLDVWPDVIAYGILLIPKGLKPGEKRPVVVCQHGLEGRPTKTIDPAEEAYNRFAARLAERGFVAYAPQNPYIGGDSFRVLQRLANPLGKTLFSVIVRQHERTLEWLSQQPFVDPTRIGFYGISYGGKTAMRVPALLTQYCLSICSADFNEWVLKNASWHDSFSYVFTGEYEIFEWNLGHTFNYAEMAYLIAPRPFMVERGHQDGVGIDEWVAYEYAKVRRLYAALGIADRTEIEFNSGGHMIFAKGTFEFLHKHLGWPKKQ